MIYAHLQIHQTDEYFIRIRLTPPIDIVYIIVLNQYSLYNLDHTGCKYMYIHANKDVHIGASGWYNFFHFNSALRGRCRVAQKPLRADIAHQQIRVGILQRRISSCSVFTCAHVFTHDQRLQCVFNVRVWGGHMCLQSYCTCKVGSRTPSLMVGVLRCLCM